MACTCSSNRPRPEAGSSGSSAAGAANSDSAPRRSSRSPRPVSAPAGPVGRFHDGEARSDARRTMVVAPRRDGARRLQPRLRRRAVPGVSRRSGRGARAAGRLACGTGATSVALCRRRRAAGLHLAGFAGDERPASWTALVRPYSRPLATGEIHSGQRLSLSSAAKPGGRPMACRTASSAGRRYTSCCRWRRPAPLSAFGRCR